MNMARLIFLGVGGGRYVTLSQLIGTCGWILEMDGEMIYIDPGPGSLVRAKQHGFDLKKLTGVVVSHRHPDHYTDVEVVIEAMTYGAKKRKGFLISTPAVIHGDEKEPQKVSNYHLSVVERYKSMKPGDTFEWNSLRITSTPTKHRDEDGLGFVFEGSRKIGYTGDGEYYSGQEKYFQGCDCLVLNCLRPREDTWPGHMNAGQAEDLIRKAKPKLAILQHFGMKMLFGKAEREAKEIEENTGIRTIAAKDGMVLNLDEVIGSKEKSGLERFLK
ncbi:MAG: MBL fold metallo-hydrolase [Spirochaetes bacterium]|nr:MAG: MBL fold metallo-hydrolase [Spirochaetota bacterium]